MRYFIKTFGCQANEADSERVAGALEAAGMAAASSMEEADVIVINTCSVRQASEDKVYGIGPKAQELRIMNDELRIVLTGCMVGSAVGKRKRMDLADLKKKLPWVDYFVPGGEDQTAEILKVLGVRHPERSEGSSHDRRGILRPPNRRAQNDEGKHPRKRRNTKVALVPISYGCNHFCSYCVVPYARGEEKSRPFEEIVCEVEKLVENGVEEIALLGQNVNTYGKDFEEPQKSPTTYESTQSYREWFPRLLARLNEIKGLKKIEFLTSHPKDMSYELIDAIASLSKVSKYLHLPVQSGDDEILRKMNRGYTTKDYIDLVKKIRKKVPNLRLGTDVIVGFPGETEEQFENTAKLFKKVKFDVAFIAMYSPRLGTAAAKFKDDVPKEKKRKRYKKLREVFETIRKEK